MDEQAIAEADLEEAKAETLVAKAETEAAQARLETLQKQKDEDDAHIAKLK